MTEGANLANQGGTDIFLTALDPDGNVVEAYAIGSDLWTWAHNAHIPYQHIQQLGQFVAFGPAQYLADASSPVALSIIPQQDRVEVPTNHLPSGAYVFQFRDTEEISTAGRFVVVR